MRSDRRTHVPYDNKPRKSASPEAWHRVVTIKDIGSWIAFAAFVLVVAGGLGLSAYVLWNLYF